MTMCSSPKPCRSLYDWFKDMGPIAVAVVATGIALLSYRESINQEKKIERDSLIDARNLACLATRYVSPYLHDSLVASRFENQSLAFDAIIYGLKAIDFHKIRPLKLSDQFVDIYRITNQSNMWSETRAEIVKNSKLENDTVESRRQINEDIDKINDFISKKYQNQKEDLVKCRNDDDIK